MKKILTIVILMVTLSSCGVAYDLKDLSTEGLVYHNEIIYHNDKPIVRLGATEISLDNGKIVKEVTFILTDAYYNGYALNIIKFMRQHCNQMEIEVELKRE